MKFSFGHILVFLAPLFSGCEQLGIETPAAELAREEAEGKAIGGSCRQAGRALEDCYQINPRAPKAAIFSGWREMDGYMRENKIEEVKPDFPLRPAPRKGRPLEAIEEVDEPAQKKPAPKATETGTKPTEAPPAKKDKGTQSG